MVRYVWFFTWVAIVFGGMIPSADAGSCDNATSSYAAAICFDQVYRSADDRLNAAYKERMADLDDKAKELLRNAQRAWITFRDAECLNAADSSRGGTDAAIVGLRCQTILTERRTKDLEGALLSQIQGRN